MGKVLTKAFFQKCGSIGGKAAKKKTSRSQQIAWGKLGAKRRWKNHKKNRKAA